jgi:hypothetical protein
MTLALLALAFALAAAPTVEALEQGAGNAPPPPLKLRSKAAVSEALAPRNTAAPFREPVLGSEPDLLAPAGDPRRESSAWTCNGESSLCYDPDSRRIVYKPARALMPDLPGLRRENISVKRDRITFKYSF